MSFSHDTTFDMPQGNRGELALALAAILGAFGSAVGGGTSESLLPIVTAAFPQLTAWLIAYMMYRSPQPFHTLPALPPHTEND